ncbi:MAG: imidazole glycerol phosphate synthase subunit HisH [Nitrospinota bacterium]
MVGRPPIAVVDYGMGNLKSVKNGFARVGAQAGLTSDPEALLRAPAIVLPGVGAFGDCMRNLRQRGLVEPLLEAIRSGKPYLGICLGLQVLFEESEEFGATAGLGLLPGRVRRFSEEAHPAEGSPLRLKVPHMGWNQVEILKPSPLLAGVGTGDYFYFVHSYYAETEAEEVVAARTRYGVSFASSLWRGNLFATQFHPEKSGELGLEVLRRFGEMAGAPSRPRKETAKK